jgi:hypothetical protein
MTALAFISRHAPTAEQVALAAEQGFTLHSVGDADAFTVGNGFIHEAAARLDITFEGVVVVHPAAALRLCSEFLVGVFENANRAPEGAPPQFGAKALHVFDLRD